MPSRRHLAPLVLVPLIAAFLLWLFAWPAARLTPRDLDFGLVGSGPAVTATEHTLAAKAGSDAFDLHRYPDQQAARRAIEHHDIYGALVVEPKGTTLLTASAASPAVSNLLRQTLAAPPSPGAAPVTVVDVVASPPGDPRGSALNTLLLPMLVTATAGAVLSSRLTRTLLQRFGVTAGAAVLSGLAAAGIAQGWLGILGGDWVADAGVFALTSFAVTSLVAGLTMLRRTAGLTVGAALMVFVGNAFSGNTSAPELLPRAVAWIGRLLPPGAGADALRRTAFFGGHGIALEMVALAAWSLIGLALITAGTLRARARLHAVPALSTQAPTATTTAAPREPAPVLTGAEKAATADLTAADAETDSIRVVRSVPIGSSAAEPEAVGLEVTVVARVNGRRGAPATEATPAG